MTPFFARVRRDAHIMTNNNDSAKPPSRARGYAFMGGGIIGLSLVVDFVRALLHVHSAITDLWAAAIIVTGIFVGGVANIILVKARARGHSQADHHG
jgi:hypothetical protein